MKYIGGERADVFNGDIKKMRAQRIFKVGEITYILDYRWSNDLVLRKITKLQHSLYKGIL